MMGLLPTQQYQHEQIMTAVSRPTYFSFWRHSLALQIPGLTSSRFLSLRLSQEVFSTRKETIAELQASIYDEIGAIPRDMLVHVMDSFLSRLHSYEVNEGEHLQDVSY